MHRRGQHPQTVGRALPKCPESHSAAISQDLFNRAAAAIPDNDISSDAPTLAEVRTAVKKLKNGRAAGHDGIPPELLKCAIQPVSAALHGIFCEVWKSGRVPCEWRDGIIISLYKGKGSKAEYGNYRPITLFSVLGKLFARVILARLQPLLRRSR